VIWHCIRIWWGAEIFATTHFNEKEYKRVIDSIKTVFLLLYTHHPVVPQTLYHYFKEQAFIKNIYSTKRRCRKAYLLQAVSQFDGIEEKDFCRKKDIFIGTVLTALVARYQFLFYSNKTILELHF